MIPLSLPAASGLLFFLSFPQYDLWPLAWIALVPLLIALHRAPPTAAFWYGWLAGGIYYLGCIYWVTHAMVRYGNLPLWLSVAVMLLLVAYAGVYLGVFAVFYAKIQKYPALLQLFLAPAAWVALEWLRGHLLTGFPWALLGYSQFQLLPFVQVSDLTGIYGVSFLLVMINLALTQGLLAGLRQRPSGFREVGVPLLTALVVVMLVFAYGFWRLSPPDVAPVPLNVALIQGNIDQAQKWNPAYQQETLRIYEGLTRQASAQAAGRDGLDLVVWPETATPFFFERETQYRQRLEALAQDLKTPLLFGSPAAEFTDDPRSGNRSPTLYNSAYLLSAEGGLAARYDKIHLVPFGEYVPLGTLLSFLHKLVEGIGEFGAGRTFTVMEIPKGSLGVVICFEVIFPELVRQFVKRGTALMVTITNDAWFGRTSAPYQHFSMVVFRAIENRVPFVRAANTGISGYVDAYGRIRAAGGLMERTFLIETVTPKTRRSFYSEYGDLFAYLCGIIALTFGLRAFFFKKIPLKTEKRDV